MTDRDRGKLSMEKAEVEQESHREFIENKIDLRNKRRLDNEGKQGKILSKKDLL